MEAVVHWGHALERHILYPDPLLSHLLPGWRKESSLLWHMLDQHGARPNHCPGTERISPKHMFQANMELILRFRLRR